jgi:hypothetical protein
VPDYQIELGKLLCTRAELENQIGDTSVAVNTLAEAEAIAAQADALPDSELGRRLASVRQALAGNPAR